MSILAIDCATSTGCCDGLIGGEPRCWSWYLDDVGTSRPARFALLASFLRRYFETQPCDAVCYENPLALAVMARIGAQEATISFLRGAIGVIELLCEEHGKPVRGINVQDAREGVLGWRTNRTSVKTKQRVIDEVRLFGCHVENEHEADANIIWRYACASCNPRLAVAMTPLFRERTTT